MKGHIYKKGERCANEKEKRERYLAAQLRYATKNWTCEICDRTILLGNKSKHLKTNFHIKNKENYTS